MINIFKEKLFENKEAENNNPDEDKIEIITPQDLPEYPPDIEVLFKAVNNLEDRITVLTEKLLEVIDKEEQEEIQKEIKNLEKERKLKKYAIEEVIKERYFKT